MLIKKRPDGSPIKVPGFTKLMPIMMPTRTESTIYMEQTIELNKTMEFMEEWNSKLPEGARRLSVMQILLTAMARTVAMRPKLNRFISNYRFYQRNNISFSFVAKKTLSDDGKEVNITMPFKADDTLESVADRFRTFVDEVKFSDTNKNEGDTDLAEKLPIWALRVFFWFLKKMDKWNWTNPDLLRFLPFYCTAFLTNVGSLKIDAPFHHNFELGNTAIFVALGMMRTERELDADGNVVDKRRVKVTYSIDDRIVDGIYSGRAIKLIKDFVENPEKLVEPARIDPKYIEELNLTEKGWKLWAKN